MTSSRRQDGQYSEQVKSRLIEESLAPGANVSAIARREKMPPSRLFGWRRKRLDMRRADPAVPAAAAVSPHFARVEAPRPSRSGIIEVQVGQIVVRAGADVDADHLARVIRGMLP
ncbi:MAG: transposase [Phycisphaerales bacterium]|nr:transposase [Phycisphaerales bacterium]